MDYQSCSRRTQTVGVVFVLSCSVLGSLVATTMLHKVLWATDDVFFYNKTAPSLEVQMGDAVDFVCPRLIHQQAARDSQPDHVAAMYDFSIYQVSPDEFSSCKVTRSSRFVFRCNKPHMTRRYTFHVVEFTAIPGGLEFKCDQNYHFIAATNGIQDQKNNTDMCINYNTKLQIKVSCDIFNKEVTEPTDTDGHTDGKMTGKKPVAPSADDSRVTIIVVVCVAVGVIFIVIVIVFVVLILRRRKQTRHSPVERRGSRQEIDIIRNQDNTMMKLAVVDITKPQEENNSDEHLYWTILDETNERMVE